MEGEYQDQVEGRNSVIELLKAGKDINRLYVQAGERKGSINEILNLAKEKRVVITEVDKNKLDKMSETHNHQGVIAIVPPYEYADIDDILEEAKKREEKPFIIILDGIEDPHNLGSIIRTAECAGAHGVVIPKRRGCLVNSTVNKTSAGAVQYMKIALVTNLNDTIKYLQEKNVWIYGTDMDGTSYYNEENYADSGVGIVIGSEGFGMSKLVKEHCDFLVKIPMCGEISSLNASVSAAIVMYEVMNQRKDFK
jgi:23S rRNA (guanosine2251-2'-O)-methyltransferase